MQQKKPVRDAAAKAKAEAEAEEASLAAQVPLHTENEWNICLVDDDDPVIFSESAGGTSSVANSLPDGLRRELPESDHLHNTEITGNDFVQSGGDLDDLDELQKQLEALNAM